MKYPEEIGVLRLFLDCLQGSHSTNTLEAREYYTQIEDTNFLSVIDNPHIRRVVSYIHTTKLRLGEFPKKGDLLAQFSDDLEALEVIDEALSTEVTYSLVVSNIERALRLKALLKLVQDITRYKDDPDISVEELYEMGREALKIHTDSRINFGVDFTDEERLYLQEDSTTMYIPTKIIPIDEMMPMNGFRYGWLVVFAAGPGFGKSLMLQNIALGHFLQGKTVLYFTLEMLEREVQQRFDTMFLAGLMDIAPDYKWKMLVDNKVVHQANVNADEAVEYSKANREAIIVNAAETITPTVLRANIEEIVEGIKVTRMGIGYNNFLKIMYYPPGELSPQRLSDLIERFSRHTGAKVDTVIVDYADLMKPPLKRDSRWEEIADVFVSLKRIAVNNNVLMLTATQVGKKAMFKQTQTQADLYGSSEKSFNADYIFNLTRPESMHRDGDPKLNIIVTKHRHGITTPIRMSEPVRRILHLDSSFIAYVLLRGILRLDSPCTSTVGKMLGEVAKRATNYIDKNVVISMLNSHPAKKEECIMNALNALLSKGEAYNNSNNDESNKAVH